MASSHANENAPQCKTCRCGEGDTNIWTTKTPENLEKQVNKCPNCQVIKSGPLLVSSRGIGWTSWKKRWFILTRTSLVFFRSDPNVPPPKGSEPNLTLGGIDLTNSGSVVVKPDKKLLTVLFPDGRDGRTFTLKAETLEDLNEWKTALENALAQAPSAALAMGQSGILRTDVADSIEASFEQWRDRRPGKSLVVGRPILLALEDIDGSPSFLEKALRYIEQYGIKVEGILRQSADVEEVERRVQEYEQGKNEFSADEDAHVIGDCIKHVLRELPSSPVPASCCTALVEAYRTDRRSRVDAMRAAIYGSFPEPNLHLLQRFVWHTNLLHCDHSDIVGEVDMATRHHQAVVSQQQRATSSQSRDAVHAGKQKVVAEADGRNRQALGDIGNLVNLRGPDGKLVHEINRPVTRSFGAQLLVNAPAAAAANKKPVAVYVSEAKDGVKAAKQKQTMKPSKRETVVITISPDTVEETKHAAPKSSHRKSSMKKVQTLTSVLTARSKVACGVADKPNNQKIQDIDALDADDQLAVVDYVEDIYKFYKHSENSYRPDNYMESQLEINAKMRAILGDWLIEVHHKFELMPETLYLTFYVVDRYLSMAGILRKELQLVGVSSMLIACKYEEIWAPEVNDFICISDMAYTREDILAMEKEILNKLEWNLTVPTPYVFLVRFLKASQCDEEMENMVFFFAELAMLHYSMIKYCPSMLAASAVYAARCTLKKSPVWSETLKCHTGFSEPELQECTKMLVNFHSLSAESKLKVVHNKYSSSQRCAVALQLSVTKMFEGLKLSE